MPAPDLVRMAGTPIGWDDCGGSPPEGQVHVEFADAIIENMK
jgi:hypothetical protein